MMDNNPQGFKELQPGTMLNAGKYIIEKKIGEGGFGITYKAVQTGLYRPVCIKEYFLAGRCVRNTQARTVHLQGITNEMYEKYRQSFVKEAQTVASLHHPNIVEVIDIFDENNTSYMVMSFIEGRSLQDMVDAGGPLSYPDAVNYMAQVTSAVAYIHERNILHRDIKPENIMVTADYKAILIDFGSAREFEQDKTQMHTSMLTHGYAPPEQYTANSRKGSYTDIYALGATLYFILTARVPLEAAARWTEELVEPKKLNPSIPSEVNQTIMKAMKLKTEERYQVVQDFMNDLKNVHGGNEDSKPRNAKRLVFWIALAAVLLAGAVTVTYTLVHRNSAPTVVETSYLEKRYDEALESFNRKCGFIPKDKKNNVGDRGHVIDALESLQVIEQCEADVLFSQLGRDPVFRDKLQEYRDSLVVAKNKILDDCGTDIARGVDDGYVKGMSECLSYIEYMLDQTDGNSVLNVQIRPSYEQNATEPKIDF